MLKKVVKAIFFLFYISETMIAQDFSDYKKPIIFFVETNPWLMVIGSDVPSFALYESGLVIYRIIEDRKIKYYCAKLDDIELKKLIDDIISSEEIFTMEEEIEASTWTDQPNNILVINFDRKKVINVYGNLSENEVRNRVPTLFIEIFDKIKPYRNNSSYEWEPPFIEVMLWDYSYAPNKRDWPKMFPDLNSSSTLKRGNSYSIYIEKDKQKEFLEFYSARREKEAVEINGMKMTMAYRIPFPNINFEITDK